MRKQGLCVHKTLTTFWTLKFHNFVDKHSSLMKHLQLVHITRWEYNAIHRWLYRESKICGIM